MGRHLPVISGEVLVRALRRAGFEQNTKARFARYSATRHY